MSAALGPQGKLPFKPAPRIQPAMRSLLETCDEHYEEGRKAGRREVEEEYMNSGLITWAIGVACGVAGVFGFRAVAEWVAHWFA